MLSKYNCYMWSANMVTKERNCIIDFYLALAYDTTCIELVWNKKNAVGPKGQHDLCIRTLFFKEECQFVSKHVNELVIFFFRCLWNIWKQHTHLIRLVEDTCSILNETSKIILKLAMITEHFFLHFFMRAVQKRCASARLHFLHPLKMWFHKSPISSRKDHCLERTKPLLFFIEWQIRLLP